MNIIITCPHGWVDDGKPDLPSDPDGHPFDTVAKEAAETLASVLRKNNNVSLHLSDLARDICDLNRSACRDKKFREEVRLQMTKDLPGTIVIDVHSFPRDHSALDVYLFHNASYWLPSAGAYIPTAVIELTVAFLYSGISAAYMPNVPRNDIICEAAEYDLPGLVIEFDEDLSAKKIRRICRIIRRWLRGSYRGIELT